MPKKYHFVTGLPRSGSTMLGGILLQNPRFHAGMSSPLGGFVNAVMRAASNNEFASQITDTTIERLLGAVATAYAEDIAPEADVLFDTNRQWSAQMPLLRHFAPDAKVIACVRNPAWVMDSIETLTRRNPLRRSNLFGNDAERATVFSRTDTMMRPDRLIGSAWNALKEAYYSDEADRLLLVEYDILCQRPRDTLKLIYDFIGEEWFEHDFDNVEYSADTFDAKLNTPGLHTVRRKVTFSPRRSVLPPDVFERLSNLAFWQDLHATKAHKIVSQSEAPKAPDS